MTARDRLHRLVEELPEGSVEKAENALRSLLDDEDPVLRALANAPEDDEPLSEEDLAALEEGRQALARGESRPLEDVARELGL